MNGDRNDAESNKQKPKQFIPMGAIASVELEKGRWVVYLNVQSRQPDDSAHPVTNNWKRINDYSTEEEAKVAAVWVEKSANRIIRPPTGY